LYLQIEEERDVFESSQTCFPVEINDIILCEKVEAVEKTSYDIT